MTDDSSPSTERTVYDRRRVLKGVGLLGASAVAGGAGLVSMSGSAAAASAVFSVSDAGVTTNDGTVDRVFISPSGDIEWHDFDESIEHIRVRFRAKVDGTTDYETVFDETYALGDYGGHHGSFEDASIPEITLYQGERANTLFGQPADGESRTRTVSVELRVDLLNAENALADPTDEARVSDADSFSATATNAAGEVTVSASATAGMEGGST